MGVSFHYAPRVQKNLFVIQYKQKNFFVIQYKMVPRID